MRHEGYTIKDFQFWKIVLGLGLASIFIFGAMYSVQPLLPLFTEVFDIPVTYASMTMSITTIGLIIGLIVIGFFSDRKGRTIFVKWSMIGSVVPLILMPMTDTFLIIIILRFVQGFALAGVPAVALAYISEEIDRRYISVATALYISCNAIGGMLGRVITGYVTELYSWEVAFYVLAASGAASMAIVFIFLPKSENFNASEVSFSKDIEGFLFHLKNPSLLIVFGLGAVLQISFTGIWTYIPFHLTAPPFSLSLETVSSVFFAYGLGIVGSPLAGWLAGKYGLGKIRIVGILVLSVGILLTLSTSFIAIVIGLCIACLGFFTAHSLTAASVSGEATHHKGSASSLYLVSYYVGVAAGSTLLGPLWENIGWNGLVIFTAVLPIVYIVFITFRSRKQRIA